MTLDETVAELRVKVGVLEALVARLMTLAQDAMVEARLAQKSASQVIYQPVAQPQPSPDPFSDLDEEVPVERPPLSPYNPAFPSLRRPGADKEEVRFRPTTSMGSESDSDDEEG